MKSLEVLLVFLRLGFTSFGGPVAHLGYFRQEFVVRRKWIDDHAYADLVALCQFLPGPASSQVGMAIGFFRSGVLGAILAWIGFTIPSAIILVLFGLGITRYDPATQEHWLHGLKVVAVSVVAQAIYNFWKKFCPDIERSLMAITCAAAMLFVNSGILQILILVLAALYGAFLLKNTSPLRQIPETIAYRKGLSKILLISFFALLIILPILRSVFPSQALNLFESFYRVGSLVFGGGHVVLALLQTEVVPTGWVSNDLFMAGYGMANAIPGPLFTFSAYLGTVSSLEPNGVLGALICLVAAFLPSFFLVIGALPFWDTLRTLPKVRQSLSGVNAAVVGLLLAAFYHPVWTSAIFSLKDFVMAGVGFILLEWGKLPSWLIVLLGLVYVSL